MNDTPSPPDAPSAAERLRVVQERIAAAAKGAGRDPATVTLVAVGKTFGGGRIRPLIEAGQRAFGENRVQESLEKWPALKEAYPDVDLHLIGPLQSNKTREAVGLFDVIETIDRPKIAHAIAREMARAGKKLKLMVQVNTGEEPQKAGVRPDDLEDMLRLCQDELGLTISGLMCIPPIDEEPALHFALLANLAERHRMPELSMGMSADFETAIALGATHVRVGTALFGPRSKPPA